MANTLIALIKNHNIKLIAILRIKRRIGNKKKSIIIDIKIDLYE